MSRIDLPLSVPAARDLHVGDRVSISGTLFAARRKTIELINEGKELPLESGALLYHCGPIAKKSRRTWEVENFAPDHTSALEPFLRELFSRYGVRGLIGRGELGPKAVEVCRQLSTCYLQTISGAGLLLAKKVKQVHRVEMATRSDPRSGLWEIQVEDFPAIVMIDSHGQSLYEIVRDVSNRRLQNLYL